MAEQVQSFPEAGYPWATWADGTVWCVKHGEDFDIDPKTFQTYLHNVANRRGLTVRTTRDGDSVTFQFTKEGSS